MSPDHRSLDALAQLCRPRYDVRSDASTASVDAAVFDYGGVLTTPVRDSIAAWLDRDGVDPASFSRTLHAWLSRSAPDGTPIHRLETGELSTAEFDVLLAAELAGKDGGTVAPEDLLSGLFAQMRPDPAMFDLVQDLKDAGVRVALLSNSWGNTYPRERIDAAFDLVVISGEVGMRKPNPDIFGHMLDLLKLRPERVVFVDDAEPNTDGAARLGMHTILHTDHHNTRKKVARLVPALDEYTSQHEHNAQDQQSS
jgi:epoxide hydrolase-like predicted phosphatase